MSHTVAPAVPSSLHPMALLRSGHPMALLRSGVPLTLLLDVAFGPNAAQLMARERAAGGQPVSTSRS